MSTIPLKDRPTATEENLEDFLYQMGEVDNQDRVTVEGIQFEIFKGRTGIELSFDHPGAMRYINKFKGTIWRELKGNFTGLTPAEKGGYAALRYRGGLLSFDVEFTGTVAKGAVPAPIQEEGTTIILNRALVDNIKFNSKESILEDKETNKRLTKLFGKKYEKRIQDWTWTYYQQNEVWLKEYGKSGWDPFLYGNKAFVKFFEGHMKNLRRDHDPKIPAGNYTTWNPADIWAVKNMSKVKKDIDAALKPKPQHLIELNNLLINLMEDKELIGISLKMVKDKQDAHIKLHNVETSPILRSLDSFYEVEEYDMNDIHFRYDNIWEGEASYVPTQVKIGSSDKYEINIRKSGNNISFNTQIKGAAAQGGQTPIAMVVKMLKGKKFNASHTSYPKDATEFVKKQKHYREMYNFVTKGQNVPDYNKWELSIVFLYNKSSKGKQIAIVKLMQLSFWYDALNNYSANNVKSAEFWTDLLYTGMKIKPGREFAPHAKIS